MGLLVFAAENPRHKGRAATDREEEGGERNTIKHAGLVVAKVHARYAKDRNRRSAEVDRRNKQRHLPGNTKEIGEAGTATAPSAAANPGQTHALVACSARPGTRI